MSKREKKRQQYEKNYFKKHPALDPFECSYCRFWVTPEGAGTNHRNHCPNCLSSKHLDETPGDRAATCGGRMEAIGVWVRNNGDWAIIHRCVQCGKLGSNVTGGDDSPMKLMALAVKPLSDPAILQQKRLQAMITTMEEVNKL